jgi:hypothetical protein
MTRIGFLAAALGGYINGYVWNLSAIPWQTRLFCVAVIFLIGLTVYEASDEIEKMVPPST